ncbi:MAG: hypothetical protein Ctma_0635 [Catillopecten margaritatus gill symbiont]|uniref:Uncharacterized protein n=1 Tax=Catillopecten margaritatus gill symbiont TaxID=3083288 RepID=A0AAU6PG22_9GAMM
MAYQVIQLSIKQLDLIVNSNHSLNLKKDEDYYALSFTLVYPRPGKASINTVKTLPLEDNTTFKTCGEAMIFKEKFELKGCTEMTVKLLALNNKNKFELFLSNLLSLAFTATARAATKTKVKSITNTILGKAFDQPINDIIDTLAKEQATIELASATIEVTTLLDESTSILELVPIATQSNVSETNVNEVYYEDEYLDGGVEEVMNAYLQEASMVLEVRGL